MFNIDIGKFKNKESSYSIYDIFTKNYKALVSWKTANMREQLKKLLETTASDWGNVANEPDPLFMAVMLALHTQQANMKLTFDNPN